MDGVLICPVQDDAASNGDYHAELVQNFKASCLIIQKMLHVSNTSIIVFFIINKVCLA